MKIKITANNGKAILRVTSLLVALFSCVITFILSGPRVSESQELKVANQPVVSILKLKQQYSEVKVEVNAAIEISPLRKLVYAEYGHKMHNGQVLLRRISKYQPIIEAAAKYYDLDPDLITGLIALESGGKNWAVSKVKAKGLMQIYIAPKACVKQVESYFKVAQLDLHNPSHNIFLGAATVALYIQGKNDPLLGLVAYNAGPNAIKSKSFSQFQQGPARKALKQFPLIVYAYALMAKVQRQTGQILPANEENMALFNGLNLPGVD